jgi:hypothetical protein
MAHTGGVTRLRARSNVRVGKNHAINDVPPTPKGSSRLCRGPALKPSMDIPKLATLTLDIEPLSFNVVPEDAS